MFDFGWSERPYWDRKNWASLEAYKEALKMSTTLYVGNLSFYTQESQIYALFDQVGTTAVVAGARCSLLFVLQLLESARSAARMNPLMLYAFIWSSSLWYNSSISVHF